MYLQQLLPHIANFVNFVVITVVALIVFIVISYQLATCKKLCTTFIQALELVILVMIKVNVRLK